MNIYLTGDTHREFGRIEKFCAVCATVKSDVLIILGDAGINYYGGHKDRKLKENLSELPITLLCIHGNHEIRTESIGTYTEAKRYDGLVYWEPEFPNLLFAKDGEN
jgi:3-oxoacid CoA-transferase subunit A